MCLEIKCILKVFLVLLLYFRHFYCNLWYFVICAVLSQIWKSQTLCTFWGEYCLPKINFVYKNYILQLWTKPKISIPLRYSLVRTYLASYHKHLDTGHCTIHYGQYTAQCTSHCTVHCQLYRTLYTVNCKGHCTLSTVQDTVHTAHFESSTADSSVGHHHQSLSRLQTQELFVSQILESCRSWPVAMVVDSTSCVWKKGRVTLFLSWYFLLQIPSLHSTLCNLSKPKFHLAFFLSP